MSNNVLVFCEQRRGELQSVSLELLGSAVSIAEKIDGKVVAVLIGNNLDNISNTIIHAGADKVYVADHVDYSHYITEPYAKALCKAIELEQPSVVLIGATSIGRDIAPRLSARLNTGLTADCTDLQVDDSGKLLMTRPAFGGNLYATIVCPDHRPQMSTVRPGVMQQRELDTSRMGDIIKLNVESSQSHIKVLEDIVETQHNVKIENADVLVSIGRGCGDDITCYHLLADNLGGVASCSRAVVDAGVLDQSRQVGQTGKTVRPQLYMALGISGAVQHVAGMEGSGYIIAINKDKSSAIFNTAHLGIVGDAREIVTALNKKLAK